ncbi:MAG TPA: penicillin-binding transpeptidase domain-containing protein [Streptosporangiales bacterium]
MSSGARRIAAAVGAVVVSACLLVACGGPDENDVARDFLAAWQRGDATAAGRLTDGEARVVAVDLAALTRDVGGAGLRLRLGGVRKTGANEATASFRASMRLSGLGVQWAYQGRFPLRKDDAGWRVVWSPSVVHPALTSGHRLALTREFPPRAPIVDRLGRRLVYATDVVTVGVVPAALKGRRHTLAVLADKTGIDPTKTRRLVDAAPKQQFLPLITLREEAYLRVRKAIHDLPGVRFRSDSLQLAKNRSYARQLLGTMGGITAEELKALGPPYTVADQVGHGGLQAAYERQLAGIPQGKVVVVDARGVTTKTVATFAGRDGAVVHTTLDERVQDAAEKALDTVAKPAALVAVQASTGQILAVANRPVSDSFDRALTGRYPPGSTFKIVTTTALLDHTKLRPATHVPCPKTIDAGGRRFRNFEGEAAGSPPFRHDFAISCNTAFIHLTRSLPRSALTQAASSYGFGTEYRIGLTAYSGQAPTPRDATEQAAETIGQGRVLASPLTMALAAAAVKSGTWHPPSLVTRPAPPAGPKPVRLDTRDAATIRTLMRSVVTSGTGHGVDLPGEPVSGKTGTAEYGSGNPPPTHAWFVGYRGDVAFAVLVEGGGVGGKVAVPVARTFLNAL